MAVCLLHLPTYHCRQHCHSFADTTDWGFFWLGLIFPLAWLIGFLRPLFRHPHFPQRQNFIGWIGNVVGKYHSDLFLSIFVSHQGTVSRFAAVETLLTHLLAELAYTTWTNQPRYLCRYNCADSNSCSHCCYCSETRVILTEPLSDGSCKHLYMVSAIDVAAATTGLNERQQVAMPIPLGCS